ncbi:MAG: HAD family hydrolase [Planctomycetota bacterium]
MDSKAIFLDRDGTVNDDVGYLNHPSQVKLLPGAAEALIELKKMGYKLIIATNQSAVARGIVSEQVLETIHKRLKELLAEKGAYLDQIYYCPFHPQGVIEKYRRDSDLRKPNTGMLTLAADEMDIDLSQSWMIGNANSDVIAGRAAGCRTILINSIPNPESARSEDARPDYQAINLKECVNIIKHHIGTQAKNAVKPSPGMTAQTQLTADSPAVESSANPEKTIHTPSAAFEDASTATILREILQQLKTAHRADMFHEFSAMKLLAGMLQIIVLLCLVLSIWFLLGVGPKSDTVFIPLCFAAVLQLMALTFYIMHNRK